MDLNHDGINDFKIQALSRDVPCGLRGGRLTTVTINPTTGNGIVVYQTNFANLFPQGVQINSRSNFYKAQTLIVDFFTCPTTVYSKSGYLGLEFKINGKTHYGWALVNYFARGLLTFDVTLLGFAYETVPGSPIDTGQISGAAADSTADPRSTNPEDSGSGPAALECPDPGTLTVSDLFATI